MGSKIWAHHREIFVSTRTGDRIELACSCDIGRTHTHQQWQNKHPRSGYANSSRTGEIHR